MQTSLCVLVGSMVAVGCSQILGVDWDEARVGEPSPATDAKDISVGTGGSGGGADAMADVSASGGSLPDVNAPDTIEEPATGGSGGVGGTGGKGGNSGNAGTGGSGGAGGCIAPIPEKAPCDVAHDHCCQPSHCAAYQSTYWCCIEYGLVCAHDWECCTTVAKTEGNSRVCCQPNGDWCSAHSHCCSGVCDMGDSNAGVCIAN